MLDKKGRKACDHFEYDISKSPPIHCRTYVDPFLKQLWRKVLWCPSNGLYSLELTVPAAKSEVDEPDIAIFIDQDVLGLEAR